VNSFDYIVVGSGAAGSVVANRLTESGDAQVLLLEAGQSEMSEAVDVLWRWNELLLGVYDWGYNSVPQPALNDHNVYSAAGKGTGGGSIVYHMMHVRARPEDLNDWAYQGALGWSWDDCLAYYQKSENQTDGTNPTAGRGGPINVVNAKDTGNPVSQTFIDAAVELGYPETPDFNSEPFGVGWQHLDVRDGKRGGVLSSYLRPALARPNLTMQVNSRATRLLFEGTRCVGVEYVRDGKLETARATSEVIVSCGSIETPKLLSLSGVGKADYLKSLGIPALLDLPGVGENLQDHPLVIGPIGRMDTPGADPRGNMTEASLFWKSNDRQPIPDIEVSLVHRAPFGENFFKNVVARIQTGEPVAPVADLVDPNVILSLPSLIRPLSRGTVRITSSDPKDAPELNPNYGRESVDIERLTDIVQIARDIYASKAFAKLGLQELSPGPTVSDRNSLREWVRNNTGSYYHFSGSCKMGIDNMAVVDPDLNVYGTQGLRIIDGSVIPTIPAANTHTTVVMIGERGADKIKASAHA